MALSSGVLIAIVLVIGALLIAVIVSVTCLALRRQQLSLEQRRRGRRSRHVRGAEAHALVSNASGPDHDSAPVDEVAAVAAPPTRLVSSVVDVPSAVVMVPEVSIVVSSASTSDAPAAGALVASSNSQVATLSSSGAGGSGQLVRSVGSAAVFEEHSSFFQFREGMPRAVTGSSHALDAVDQSFHMSMSEARDAGHDDAYCRIVDLVEKGEFVKSRVLGRGAFGCVYLCILGDGTHVAMKEVVAPPSSASVEEFVAGVRKEVRILMNLNHPNIIKIYGCHVKVSTMTVQLFMELAGGGSLHHMAVTARDGITDDVARRLIAQVVNGLAYLHERGYVHGDCKCLNYALSQTGVVKIIDFGTVAFIGPRNGGQARGLLTMRGSILHIAPEQLTLGGSSCSDSGMGDRDDGELPGAPSPQTSKGFGRRIDCWSLGISVLELFNRGVPTWPSFDSPAQALTYIASPDALPTFPEYLTEDCRSFLRRCLVRDPKRRATMAELLRHKWLQTPVVRFVPEPMNAAAVAVAARATDLGTSSDETGIIDMNGTLTPSASRGVFSPVE